METYLRTMIRQVDSSLLDEWEKMRRPDLAPRADAPEVRPPGAEEAEADITRDRRAFTALVRTHIFTFLRGVVIADYKAALAVLSTLEDAEGQPWSAARLDKAMEAYHADHQQLCLNPEARNQRHTYVVPSDDGQTWRVQQMLVDPEGHNDWVAEFAVDLAASREKELPVLRLSKLGALGQG
jgi:hypothetical protein